MLATFNAYDYTTDPLAAKLFLQADLKQLKGSEKCTFAGACGQCIERSTTATTLAASGSFPIVTLRRESSCRILSLGSLSDKKQTAKSRVYIPLILF